MKRSFLNEVITDNSEREVDDSFSNFLYGFSKMKSIKESLDDVALTTEITLFIEGDSTLHGQIPTIKKTLFRHFKRGEYDSNLAERAWTRLVSEGSQRYAADIGKEPRLWEELIAAGIRQAIVEKFESEFYNDLKRGKVNVEELFNE
jgi:hypothetical protein